MNAHAFTLLKGFILDADACTDADTIAELPVFAHEPCSAIQQALAGIAGIFSIDSAAVHNARTRCKSSVRFDERLIEAQEIMRLAAHIDPVDLIVIHHGMEFIFRKIRDCRADLC